MKVEPSDTVQYTRAGRQTSYKYTVTPRFDQAL